MLSIYRSRSPHERDLSKERWREERKKMREEEKQQQMVGG